MKLLIKKILKESTLNRDVTDKVYNHIKDDFWFEHNKNYRDGQVVTSFHTSSGDHDYVHLIFIMFDFGGAMAGKAGLNTVRTMEFSLRLPHRRFLKSFSSNWHRAAY